MTQRHFIVQDEKLAPSREVMEQDKAFKEVVELPNGLVMYEYLTDAIQFFNELQEKDRKQYAIKLIEDKEFEFKARSAYSPLNSLWAKLEASSKSRKLLSFGFAINEFNYAFKTHRSDLPLFSPRIIRGISIEVEVGIKMSAKASLAPSRLEPVIEKWKSWASLRLTKADIKVSEFGIDIRLQSKERIEHNLAGLFFILATSEYANQIDEFVVGATAAKV